MKLEVLYEDNHLIATLKPAGVLTQGDDTGDISLIDEVRKYLKEKYKKPGNVFVGLLHRLDRPVSGIVLFAKTSKGAARLSEQFRNREVKKTYHAVVSGKPENNRGEIINFLEKDEKNKKAKVGEQGKEAKLFYEVISSNDKYSLLKIKIEGGRFHQIRAQLSFAGLPIAGDIKYGSPITLKDKSLMLCATSLTFKTAVTKEEKNISIEIPKTWKTLI
jgi:23S rRNA pseudouridine1911/1915/1917 synthase